MKTKNLFLLTTSALSLLFSTAHGVNGWECGSPCDPSCLAPIGPLEPCHYRLAVRGGASPQAYTSKTDSILIGTDDENGFIAAGGFPDFLKQFDVPWTVGASLGYNYDEHIEFFVDAEYARAKGKKLRAESITQKWHDYSHWSVALGARYYCDPSCICCTSITPFVGAKMGVRFYDEVKLDESVETFSARNLPFFKDHVVPTVAAQFGLDWELCDGVSLVNMIEVQYSGQFRGNREAAASGALAIGDTGPVISVPVTIGLSYTL